MLEETTSSVLRDILIGIWISAILVLILSGFSFLFTFGFIILAFIGLIVISPFIK